MPGVLNQLPELRHQRRLLRRRHVQLGAVGLVEEHLPHRHILRERLDLRVWPRRDDLRDLLPQIVRHDVDPGEELADVHVAALEGRENGLVLVVGVGILDGLLDWRGRIVLDRYLPLGGEIRADRAVHPDLRDLRVAGRVLRLDLGVRQALDDVNPELRFDEPSEVARLDAEYRVAEFRHHLVAREQSVVAAPVLRAGVGAVLLGHRREVGVVDLRQDLGRELAHGILFRRRDRCRRRFAGRWVAEEDVAGADDAADGGVVPGFGVRRVDFDLRAQCVDHHRHPHVVDQRLNGYGDRRRQRVVVGGGVAQALIVGPQVGDDASVLRRRIDPDLGGAEHGTEAGRAEILIDGARRHVRCGRQRRCARSARP